MKNFNTIGLPSKGRLKDKSISFFNARGLKVIQNKNERNIEQNLRPDEKDQTRFPENFAQRRK